MAKERLCELGCCIGFSSQFVRLQGWWCELSFTCHFILRTLHSHSARYILYLKAYAWQPGASQATTFGWWCGNNAQCLPAWKQSGPMLGAGCADVGPSRRAHVEPSWAHMLGQAGPMLSHGAHLGPMLAQVGPMLGYVGLILGLTCLLGMLSRHAYFYPERNMNGLLKLHWDSLIFGLWSLWVTL